MTSERPLEPVQPDDLRAVTLMAARLGVIAFGGPAAHIALLRSEVVSRRAWLTDQRFLDLLGISNLIPGPNSTELVMHVGQERAGIRGLVAAGVAFILPAASITLLFAWAYMRWGSTPDGTAVLDGIKPVVLVVILQAVWNLGRTGLRNARLVIVSALVFLLYLLGLNELVLLIGGTLLSILLHRLPDPRALTHPNTLLLAPSVVIPSLSGLGMAGAASEYSGLRLFLTFLRIGATLYGSGYVLVAFLRRDFVDRLGWLTDKQLLDAIAIGQFTPGPVFSTATFVGYVAGGTWGAVLATVAIFLPAFVLVGITHPQLDRLLRLGWSRPVLDGLNAAAIGLMAAVAVILGRDALTGPLAWLLVAATAVLLFRFRVNSAILILAGGILGLAASLT